MDILAVQVLKNLYRTVVLPLEPTEIAEWMHVKLRVSLKQNVIEKVRKDTTYLKNLNAQWTSTHIFTWMNELAQKFSGENINEREKKGNDAM